MAVPKQKNLHCRVLRLPRDIFFQGWLAAHRLVVKSGGHLEKLPLSARGSIIDGRNWDRDAAMALMGFFDFSNRYVSRDAKLDPLVEIDAMVPWEEFRAALEEVWRKPMPTGLRNPRDTWLRGDPSECPLRQESAGPQNRCERCRLVATTAFLRPAPRQFPHLGGDRHAARLYAATGTAHRICRRSHPAHAKGADEDEPATVSCRHRYDRCDGYANHLCHGYEAE